MSESNSAAQGYSTHTHDIQSTLTVNGTVEPVKELSLRSGDDDSGAKVNQLDLEVVVNDNVFVFDVSVADSSRIQVLDTFDNLLKDHPCL